MSRQSAKEMLEDFKFWSEKVNKNEVMRLDYLYSLATTELQKKNIERLLVDAKRRHKLKKIMEKSEHRTEGDI